MSQPIATEKRTRSQLTLSNDILQLSLRSPLKDARTSLRNTSNTLESTSSMSTRNTEETDGELLLTSPSSYAHFPTKRSASPLQDEYTSYSGSPSEGRELKRTRHDLGAESDILLETTPHITSSNHSRSHSQPNLCLGQKGMEGSTITYLTRKPTSSSSTYPTTTNVFQSKGRAQSVPLFPPTPIIPHLDLRNPPLSPVRARSRSPLKDWEPKMRLVSGANNIAEMDSKEASNMIVDSTEVKNTVPSQALRPPTPPSANETVTLPSALKANTETNTLVLLPPKPPLTPVAEGLLSTHFWSPLTPLPETPHPLKFMTNVDQKSPGIRWEDETDEAAQECGITADHILQGPRYTEPVKEGWPAPASSGIPPAAVIPPVTSTRDVDSMKIIQTQFGQPSGLIKPKSAVAIVKRSGDAPGDAFSVMMAQARLDKSGNKSKRMSKEKGSYKKAASSSTGTFNVKGKDPMTRKKEEKSKPSLKAKMRPKQIPKAKPVPVPVPDLAPGDEADDTSMPSDPLPREISQNQSPIFFPNTSTIPTSKEPKHFIPGSLPPSTSSFIAPSGVLRLHPETVGPRIGEGSPITTILTEETSNPGESLGDTSQIQVSFNPVSTATTTSKLPRAKRVPPSTFVENVTRRVSSRLKGKDVTMSNTVVRKISVTKHASSNKQQAMRKTKPFSPELKVSEETATASTSSLSDIPSDYIPDKTIPPGSPMKLGSPVRRSPKVQDYPFIKSDFSTTTNITFSKTPSRPKTKSKSESPSPSKLSRSTSMFSVRPTAPTFTSHSGHAGQSSLSTLANALEKLRMPPPPRPSTSMGFDRDSGDKDDIRPWNESDRVIKQNVGPEPKSLQGSSIGQAITFKQSSRAPLLNQTSSTTHLQSGTGPIMRSLGSGNAYRSRPIFGSGNRLFGVPGRVGAPQKVSRKTSLPSVTASPVKDSRAVEYTPRKGDKMDSVFESQNGYDQEAPLDPVLVVETTEGKGASQFVGTQRNFGSRRASLASQSLSQSLSSLPSFGGQTAGIDLMSLPAAPFGRSGTRSASNNHPTSPHSLSNTAPESEMLLKTRSIARSTPEALGEIKGDTNEPLSPARKQTDGIGVGPSKFAPESLKVLRDCIIFVDVRTDDGDEAGSLFVEMLESVGARILTRVGQTCTHIVYKNGLVSTSTRYRLLRDPKPFVVGIAWVVECVEQRQHVDETKFIIDLNNININGVNKRRRSMLPKAIAREIEDTRANNDGDQSISGPSSSMTKVEDLTPLEKARRRKGTL